MKPLVHSNIWIAFHIIYTLIKVHWAPGLFQHPDPHFSSYLVQTHWPLVPSGSSSSCGWGRILKWVSAVFLHILLLIHNIPFNSLIMSFLLTSHLGPSFITTPMLVLPLPLKTEKNEMRLFFPSESFQKLPQLSSNVRWLAAQEPSISGYFQCHLVVIDYHHPKNRFILRWTSRLFWEDWGATFH